MFASGIAAMCVRGGNDVVDGGVWMFTDQKNAPRHLHKVRLYAEMSLRHYD
jgi:hypothetical protein